MFKEKKYPYKVVILLLFVIGSSLSQVITRNRVINLQQGEVYQQELSDLYDFTAKSISLPLTYDTSLINAAYTSLSADTKNNQLTTIPLASYNFQNAKFQIGLNFQEKSNNNIDIVFSYNKISLNPKTNIIRREELTNRKIETIDPSQTPNYYYGSMFNNTSGFISYFYINNTEFKKAVYFFNYTVTVGITLVEIPDIDLFKHTSILGPSGAIYLIQYRFEQFQLYKYNNTEISLVDLTKIYESTPISNFVVDEGQFYLAFGLANSTLYYSSLNFGTERLTIREIVLPQTLSVDSKVYGQRLGDYLMVLIADTHQTMILKLQTLDFVNNGALRVEKNTIVPFGVPKKSSPTFISHNNFIFVSNNQIQLADVGRSRIIFSQKLDSSLSFYQLEFYQNQFILYFSNLDPTTAKITYPSKQVQLQVPTFIILGSSQQISVLISSYQFPFSVNVVLQVTIPQTELVTFSQSAVLMTKQLPSLQTHQQSFPVELFVTGADLSLTVTPVDQQTKSLISEVNFVKIQPLKPYQKLIIEDEVITYQTDYYFASLTQKRVTVSSNKKSMEKMKKSPRQSRSLKTDSQEANNDSDSNDIYQIMGLLPLSNEDATGGIQQLKCTDTFTSAIDQIDNSGSFVLAQDKDQTTKRIYIPFVQFNTLITNYYDVNCSQQLLFATDPFQNVIFTACGPLLQMTSYITKGFSKRPIIVTQLFNITIDNVQTYNQMITNRGILFIYNPTTIAAFDYTNFNYFPSTVQIPQKSDTQKVILFRDCFIIVYNNNSQNSLPKQTFQADSTIKVAQYSYKQFQSTTPVLLRYLETSNAYTVNSSINIIAVRNDIEYLLLQQQSSSDQYNLYRVSINAYSQNQLYSTLSIPVDVFLAINSSMYCILQSETSSSHFGVSEIVCNSILESASIQFQLSITDDDFYNNLSLTAELALTNANSQTQYYTLVLQRNADLKNMLINQKQTNLQLMKTTFYDGSWEQSTVFSFNDQKIMNTCILGWMSDYLPCKIQNRITYEATNQMAYLLNLSKAKKVSKIQQYQTYITKQNKQDQIIQTNNTTQQYKQQQQLLQQNSIKQKTEYKKIRFFSQDQNNSNSFMQFNKIQNQDEYQSVFEDQQELYHNQDLLNGENEENQINSSLLGTSSISESDIKISLFTILYDQRVLVTSSSMVIMNLLTVNENYYGCVVLDDSASVTNQGTGVFYMNLYILCPKYIYKFPLQITKNQSNIYTKVILSQTPITYTSQYSYDVDTYSRILTFDIYLFLIRFNGIKYQIAFQTDTTYTIEPTILDQTIASLNTIYSLESKIQITFYSNGMLLVQVKVSDGILNEYLSIVDLFEESDYSIQSSDSINTINQYGDTTFRVAFSDSFVYDIELTLDSEQSIQMNSISLYYYRDAFPKLLSGFKGTNYHLFFGQNNNDYLLTLYSFANSKQSQYLIEAAIILPLTEDQQGIRYVTEDSISQFTITFSKGQMYTFKISDLVQFQMDVKKTQIPSKGILLFPIKLQDTVNTIVLLAKQKPPQPLPESFSKTLPFSLLLFILSFLFIIG